MALMQEILSFRSSIRLNLSRSKFSNGRGLDRERERKFAIRGETVLNSNETGMAGRKREREKEREREGNRERCKLNFFGLNRVLLGFQNAFLLETKKIEIKYCGDLADNT